MQNVETLAHVALIARFGSDWFRTLGCGGASGSALVTVSGAVPEMRVIEVAQGQTLAAVVNAAGGLTTDGQAVLLGGYFGTWLRAADAWTAIVDATALRERGLSLGCGVIGVLPSDRCGVAAASRVMSYLAHESSRQCGPCTFGLRAIATATSRLAGLTAEPGDLTRVQRWSGLLAGRGACRHPDGAQTFLQSALRVFTEEFNAHSASRRCTVRAAAPVPA